MISGGRLALHNAESKILFRIIELIAESDKDLVRGASNAEILKRINITPVDFRATRWIPEERIRDYSTNLISYYLLHSVLKR